MHRGATRRASNRTQHATRWAGQSSDPWQSYPSSERILIVDDNQDAAELLGLMLRNSGYQTEIAYDGQAAIEATQRFVPDVVVSDIGLPDMTGYEVAQRLRADARLQRTALIALTGWGTPEDRSKAIASGFNVHLTKPVSAEDLHAALDGAAVRRHRRAALAS